MVSISLVSLSPATRVVNWQHRWQELKCGTYSGVFTPTTSGAYYLGAWVVDGETEDKLPQGDTATVDVIATEMVALDLVSASPVEINMVGRDQFMNPVPEPSLSAVNCSSGNPDITPGPVTPDPDSPQWGLQVGVRPVTGRPSSAASTAPPVAQ